MFELSPLERRALELPVGVGVPLSEEEVDILLADPAYGSSLGQPGHAIHYRRGLPDGTGLHLVIHATHAELHRDHFDPHASPTAMLLHLVTDSPTQALGTLSAAWAVLKRLGR